MTRRRKITISIVSIGILLVLYVGSYWVNSTAGGYWMKPDRDGRDKYSMGLSMTTAIMFQPAVGYHTPFGGDLLGTFYAPLIRLDRHYFHPTRYLSDDGTWEWAQSLPIEEMHPSFREEARNNRAGVANKTGSESGRREILTPAPHITGRTDP